MKKLTIALLMMFAVLAITFPKLKLPKFLNPIKAIKKIFPKPKPKLEQKAKPAKWDKAVWQ